MPLIMKGKQIPQKRGSLRMLGESPVHLQMEGEMVWQVPKFVQIFNADGNFVVPAGVESLIICASAGGGGGGIVNGGSAGGVLSSVSIIVVPEEVLAITVGLGGAIDTNGGDTTIGTYSLTGGTSGNYLGTGASKSTCGGTWQDGVGSAGVYGGEAGTFGNGGAPNNPGDGGGGGGSSSVGGRGKVVITYYKGE